MCWLAFEARINCWWALEQDQLLVGSGAGCRKMDDQRSTFRKAFFARSAFTYLMYRRTLCRNFRKFTTGPVFFISRNCLGGYCRTNGFVGATVEFAPLNGAFRKVGAAIPLS